jgi:integrase
MALVRAADSEQDAAIYLTAAFTGLRQGELVALRWRDIDFPGCAIRVARKLHQRPSHESEVGTPAQCRWRTSWRRRSRGGRLSRRLSARQVLRAHAPRASKPAAAPLPRPPPHVRHPRHRSRRHPACTRVDGSRQRSDGDEVPALQTAEKDAAIVGRAFAVGQEAAAPQSGDVAERLPSQRRLF